MMSTFIRLPGYGDKHMFLRGIIWKGLVGDTTGVASNFIYGSKSGLRFKIVLSDFSCILLDISKIFMPSLFSLAVII